MYHSITACTQIQNPSLLVSKSTQETAVTTWILRLAQGPHIAALDGKMQTVVLAAELGKPQLCEVLQEFHRIFPGKFPSGTTRKLRIDRVPGSL